MPAPPTAVRGANGASSGTSPRLDSARVDPRDPPRFEPVAASRAARVTAHADATAAKPARTPTPPTRERRERGSGWRVWEERKGGDEAVRRGPGRTRVTRATRKTRKTRKTRGSRIAASTARSDVTSIARCVASDLDRWARARARETHQESLAGGWFARRGGGRVGVVDDVGVAPAARGRARGPRRDGRSVPRRRRVGCGGPEHDDARGARVRAFRERARPPARVRNAGAIPRDERRRRALLLGGRRVEARLASGARDADGGVEVRKRLPTRALHGYL